MTVFIYNSINKVQFHYKEGLAKNSNIIADTKGFAIFLSGSYYNTYTAYYFPNAKVQKDKIVYLSKNTILDSNLFKNNFPKFIFYNESCRKDDDCRIQQDYFKKNCQPNECFFSEL